MDGRAWLYGFFCRNSTTASRKAQYLNPGRVQKLSRFLVNDYLAKLKKTREELGVMSEPECIYNVDKIKDVDCAFTNSLLY
jgi:hypothetical protein